MNKNNSKHNSESKIAKDFSRFMGGGSIDNGDCNGVIKKFSLYDHSQYVTRTSSSVINTNLK